MIYVATTRAEDLLILSSILSKKDNLKSDIITLMKEVNPNNFVEIETTDDLKKLPATESVVREEENEIVKLSHTSINEYLSCPRRYNLNYNYGFKTSGNQYTELGVFTHSVLNQLHQKQIDVDKKYIDMVINRTLDNNKNISSSIDPALVEEVIGKIHEYWDKFGKHYDVVGSEVPFDIQRDNYNLTGQIDLLIKDEENKTLTIIDFKTTTEYKIQKDSDAYTQQLYLYSIAVRENPEYSDYTISELIDFSIRDLKEVKVPYDKEKVDMLENKIHNVATRIINDEFDKNCENCTGCPYKAGICKFSSN